MSNLVSTQYLGNKLMEFDQVKHVHDVDQTRFCLLCVNFSKFTTQLWPLDIVKIPFSLNVLPVEESVLHVKPVPGGGPVVRRRPADIGLQLGKSCYPCSR